MLKITFNSNIEAGILDSILQTLEWQYHCRIQSVSTYIYIIKNNPSIALMNFIQQLQSTYHIVDCTGKIIRKF